METNIKMKGVVPLLLLSNIASRSILSTFKLNKININAFTGQVKLWHCNS